MEWHTLTLPRSLTDRASLYSGVAVKKAVIADDENSSDVVSMLRAADCRVAKVSARDAAFAHSNHGEGPPGKEP